MKIKLEVEIDTKQDMDEINQLVEIVSAVSYTHLTLPTSG